MGTKDYAEKIIDILDHDNKILNVVLKEEKDDITRIASLGNENNRKHNSEKISRNGRHYR